MLQPTYHEAKDYMKTDTSHWRHWFWDCIDPAANLFAQDLKRLAEQLADFQSKWPKLRLVGKGLLHTEKKNLYLFQIRPF
jgi:hypothetical protein